MSRHASSEVATGRSTDVVVIGGGVMGLSIAWKLAATRGGNVRLLEQRVFGSGESGKSGAILRQHYSHATLIRMARASLAEYRALHERTRGGIGFANPGMLFVCDGRERAALEQNVALQRSCGVQVELLDATSLRKFEPRATIEDGLVGAYEPEASFVVPGLTLAALAEEARAAGATLEEGVRVVRLVTERNGSESSSRIRGVELADGRVVEAQTVVICGGPWSARLLATAGVELPLAAVKPEQAFFIPPNSSAPTTVRRSETLGGEEPGSGRNRRSDHDDCIWADLVHGLYWKNEATGFTRVGQLAYEHDAPIADPDAPDEGVTNAFLADCRARLAKRIAAYRDTICWGGVSAMYTVTPDAQALIGPVPNLAGALIVSGFSGHGFKLAPSIGNAVTALLTGRDPAPFDPAFFAPDRFARGQKQSGAYGYSVLG